jgi:hypothetical protein
LRERETFWGGGSEGDAMVAVWCFEGFRKGREEECCCVAAFVFEKH